MRKLLALIVLLASLPLFAEVATSVSAEMKGGFPVANFAISAQVPQDGSLYGHVWANTGNLGGWLQDCGTIEVTIRRNGQEFALSKLKNKQLKRNLSIVRNVYSDSNKLFSRLTVETFCPIVNQQAEETALPVILLDVQVKATLNEKFDLCLTPQNADQIRPFTDQESTWNENRLTIPVNLKKGGSRDIRIVLVHTDSTWVSAQRFDTDAEVARYALDRYDLLRRATEAYGQSLPWTGDKRVDACLPYYLLPALVLTRMNRDGQVLTLGYNELNQRDSFWTTWMHLVHFPEMEWKMIEESYAAMRDTGKIPTCIMPEIERWDDLDINLFLILRTARYYAMYRNRPQVQTLWPRICKVMDWVIGRDLDHVGIPQQVSFWGDWKDVKFMEGRKYSPFVAMLYLAALNQMSKLAAVCGDQERGSYYTECYQKSYAQINKPVSEGGLWNGQYYDQIWQDGTAKGYLCQDQMVGVLYDVIPAERVESIIRNLNEKALTPYGVCNMVPYLPGVEYPEGTYHNGAVWPWTSFMDCWARIRAGHRKEAIDILQRVYRADILDSGDYVPNEHINSLTGENLGFPVQGWNADLYGLMFFGLKNRRLDYKL